MADSPPDGPLSPPSPPTETTFSDDPVEHSTLSATFMVSLLVTWLIFGHKIQGMFHWCVAHQSHILPVPVQGFSLGATQPCITCC
jgi:hypothetical protein